MILDEASLDEIRKGGARVRGAGGSSLRSVPEKTGRPSTPPGDAVNRSILSVLREMVVAVAALAKREPDQVTVAAPAVTLKPEINVPPQPTEWFLEVVERGEDGRAKKWKITTEK